MSKINTVKWKEFEIGEFFEFHLSSDDIQPKNIKIGEIPLVSAGKENNGIVAYISNDKARLWDKNTITVDMFGKAFYQPKPYFAVSHGRVNILIPKIRMSEYVCRYFASIIEKIASDKYEFTEMCTGKKISKDIIKLPVDNEGNPNRVYMENYIKTLEEKCKTKLQNLILARGGVVHLINTKSWKEFRVGDLFDISSPSPRSQNNYEDGETPFVASGDVNNGILKYCTPKKDEKLDNGNCITISPVDGSSFYQEKNFLGRGGAGSSIMILRNDNLNKFRGLFIAGIIRKCCNFTYNDMGNREKFKNLVVKFPVDNEGNPNREYMENYMKNLMEKNKEKLNCLN